MAVDRIVLRSRSGLGAMERSQRSLVPLLGTLPVSCKVACKSSIFCLFLLCYHHFMKRREPQKSLQSMGGEARMSTMSKREREDFASKGGRVGGKARAQKLSSERRSEIARAAALARWKKAPPTV
jgi:hypothetical protein